MNARLHLVPPPAPKTLSILDANFATKIEAFNSVSRRLREAGIGIEAASFLDNRLFIRAEDVPTLRDRFGHLLRGIRSRGYPGRRYSRHVATLNQVDICWLVPLKEQDQ